MITRHILPATLAFGLTISVFSGEKGNKGEKGEKGDRREMREGKMGGGAPGIENILKHEKELGLTGDQKRKLEALKEKAEANNAKMRKDPETRELFKEVAMARKNGDEEKLRQLREKVKAINDKNGGGEDVMAEVMKVLTPDQMLKLKDLRGEGGGAMREGGKGENRGLKANATAGQKPDPAKAPSLYDNEK